MACVLAGATLVAVAPAHAYRYKEVRDWSVSCGNGLTCAMAYSNWDKPGLNYIRFVRSGAPNAPVDLELPFPPDYATKGDAKARFTVFIDGADVLEIAAADLKADTDSGGFKLSAPDKVANLIARMKAGKDMELRYQGELGRFAFAVPLAGVTGSLLYVDEAQGRLGRRDALQAKGDGPVPATVAVRDLDTYADIPGEIRADFESEAGICWIEPSGLANADGFEATIAEGKSIVVLPCQAGGAYNQPFVFYSNFGDKLMRMDFPTISANHPTATNMVYNIDYDPIKKTLASFYKGRGIGDCGSYYVWSIDAGTDDNPLVLKEQRVKDDCDGNNLGGIQNWPSTWPAK